MPRSTEREALIVVIREILEQKGLTQEQFSEACGQHSSFIPKIVRDRRDVSIDEMPAIAKAAGLTLLELYARVWARRDAG